MALDLIDLIDQPAKSSKRTKRRGNGEGSIFQRASGLWVATISLGRDQHGKRMRRTIYAWTKKEVQDELARLQSSSLAGTLTAPSRLTVATFLERWLQDVARVTIAVGTFVNYKGVVDNHINPRIGGIVLQKLTPAHVQNLYSEIERAGKGPNASKLAHCVLHRALKYAVRNGMATRNVCEAVEPPRIVRRSMQTLNAEQAIKLLATVKGDRLEALYQLAITTGLRLGEVFGLQWRDIDLKAGTLSVCRSQSDVKGKLALNEPKTAKGRRQVTLGADVVAVLWQHRAAMLAAGHGGVDRVFCNSEGGPLRRPDFHRRSFKPLLRRAGLPNIRFHDLRHTSATLLLSQGVHPKVVQERLGHSQISVTLDVYSHVMPGMQRDASDRLGALLKPATEIGNKVAVNAG